VKILIVIGGFFPAENYGGPVISIDNLCTSLGGEIDSYILTVNHDLKSSKVFDNISPGWNIRNNAKVIYLDETEINYNYLKKIVQDIKPDLIYLNSFFLAKFTTPFLKIAKVLKLPILVAPRGEFCENSFNKKHKKIPYTALMRLMYIRDNVYFHATTEDEVERFIYYLGADKNHIFNIKNIPMVTKNLTPILPNKKKLLKIVFLARIHRSKNLLYALKILSNIKFNVEFNIYGNIEDANYWDQCKKLIKILPNNIKVEYNGVAKRNEISNIFNTHHVFLFPTFSENFGHSIAESLISGCPVIISNNTPWTWVQKEKISYALSLDNEIAFIDALNNIYSLSDNEYSNMRENCIVKTNKYLDVNNVVNQYKECFSTIVYDSKREYSKN
jgi:glycosyltransferase involved in cell wall biosynthesis